MNLDEFLYLLHYESEKIRPQDWVVNWGDAPLPYKLYRGLPAYPLSSDVPLRFKHRKKSEKPGVKELGYFLWYTFGLTQYAQTVFFPETGETIPANRRFVPSGGGLYPNELYIYLKIENLPEGVYHYDAAHHRLVLLREGNFDDYLSRALGSRCDLTSSFGTVFISTMFWKNFFKYHNFSYRLQGLDTGFVIGQLLEVAEQFGYETGVYYQFLDRAVNHLLGISEKEESVYSVVPLTVDQSMEWFSANSCKEAVDAAVLCSEINKLDHPHFVRSKDVKGFPMVMKLNEACMMDSLCSFRKITNQRQGNLESPMILLPESSLSYDLASVCPKRYSPGMDFILEPISQLELTSLLSEGFKGFSYRNDLDGGFEQPSSRISLYASFYRVDGLPNGMYHYDHSIHALKTIEAGDFRGSMQSGLLSDFVNMAQIPLAFTIAGQRGHYRDAFGYRGYRIQQMEAGILSQRLLLTASALDMGGHPILGFDVKKYDDLYHLSEVEKTSLLQIPIGRFRPHPRLQGALHT